MVEFIFFYFLFGLICFLLMADKKVFNEMADERSFLGFIKVVAVTIFLWPVGVYFFIESFFRD